MFSIKNEDRYSAAKIIVANFFVNCDGILPYTAEEFCRGVVEK